MRYPTLLLLTLALVACEATEKRPAASDTDTIPAEAATSPSDAITEARERYAFEHHFPGTLKDTLLANMVTFIYKRPTVAINRDRTDPEFRAYYVGHARSFTPLFLHMTPDSMHWFYVIRPARSVEGDKRGVGGRFRTNQALEMVEFEEIFNTRILPEQELIEQGAILFEEMVNTGNVDAYLENKELIEWPDGRLFYSLEKREWRYVD
jgi:hypothetical protein